MTQDYKRGARKNRAKDRADSDAMERRGLESDIIKLEEEKRNIKRKSLEEMFRSKVPTS